MATTATVSGNLQDLTGATNAGFAIFTLANFGDNVPRIIGTTMLVSKNITFTGPTISGNIWGNDNIDPAGTFYYVTIQDNNKNPIAAYAFNITGASFNLNSATPITTSPVVTAPTGDTTYWRLDGGNSPATGPAISTRYLNTVVFADQFTGADAEAKIVAAYNALPVGGGVIDARGITGTQTWGATFTIAKSITLLLGNVTFNQTANTGRMIYVSGGSFSNRAVNIIGAGPGVTVFNGNANDDCVVSRMNANNYFRIEHLSISDTFSTTRTYGSGLEVSGGDGNTSVQATISDLVISLSGSGVGFLSGLTLELPINSRVDHIVANTLGDGFRFEGGTSTTITQCYANMNTSGNRHGFVFTRMRLETQLGDITSGITATASTASGTLGAGTYAFGVNATYTGANSGISGTNEVRYTAVASATLSAPGNIVVSWSRPTWPAWVANKEYVQNNVIEFAGFVFYVSAGGPGVSGASQPNFPAGVGATVVDGPLTWKNDGTAAGNLTYTIYSDNALVGPLLQVGSGAPTSITFSAPMTQTTPPPVNSLGLSTASAYGNYVADGLVWDSGKSEPFEIEQWNPGTLVLNAPSGGTPLTNNVLVAGKYGSGMKIGNGSQVAVIGYAVQLTSPNQDYGITITGGGNGNLVQFVGLFVSANASSKGVFNIPAGSNGPITVFGLGQGTTVAPLGSDTAGLLAVIGNSVASGSNTRNSHVLGGGLAQDASGMKHQTVTTGSIAAGARALVTLTWTTAFQDANYQAWCQVLDTSASGASLSVERIQAQSAASVTAQVLNSAAGAVTGTLQCIGVHN